jgi:hypothetical protein
MCVVDRSESEADLAEVREVLDDVHPGRVEAAQSGITELVEVVGKDLDDPAQRFSHLDHIARPAPAESVGHLEQVRNLVQIGGRLQERHQRESDAGVKGVR